MKTVLIAAGGTGGHVFPGLAIASALQKQSINVVWLGTQHGLDKRLVPEANIPFYPISIKGLRGKGKVALLLAPGKIVFAIIDALRVIRRSKADLVIGMGGYVSGPAGIAAKLLGKPLLIHEQNAIAGWTNKQLSRFANKVLQAFPNSFAASNKVLTVGNPVRESIARLHKQPRHFSALRVLVLGGSQGARVINQVMPAVWQQLGDKIELWHQTGAKLYQETKVAYAGKLPRLDRFIDDMQAAYAWADVVICRSGALTVSELAAAGLPAILIPFAAAVDDHQTANARYFTDAGAGALIAQQQLSANALIATLDRLDAQTLAQQSAISKQLSKPQATDDIIREIQNELR